MKKISKKWRGKEKQQNSSNNNNNSQPANSSPKKSPARLGNPRRLELIEMHRQYYRSCFEMYAKAPYRIPIVFPSDHESKLSKTLAQLKPIFLQDMDPLKDRVYEGCALEVTIIDAPCGTTAIATLIEDDKGQIERLGTYNHVKADDFASVNKYYFVGQRVSIVNPYYRNAADGRSAIRVDDPATLVFHHGTPNESQICFHCAKSGKETKLDLCSKCRHACYCSRDCQATDWKLGHSFLCKHYKNIPKYSSS